MEKSIILDKAGSLHLATPVYEKFTEIKKNRYQSASLRFTCFQSKNECY